LTVGPGVGQAVPREAGDRAVVESLLGESVGRSSRETSIRFDHVGREESVRHVEEGIPLGCEPNVGAAVLPVSPE